MTENPSVQDIAQDIAKIPGLLRVETSGKPEMMSALSELTHSVYKHHEVYGTYCSIEEYIDCPPEKVFRYLAELDSLNEWSFSVRGFEKTGKSDVFVGKDKIGDNTTIHCRVTSNPDAMTVDYHCAWDQGEHLWMIYLMRVIPAELVFNKPGSVVLWTNCRHPFYDKNPFPELAPKGRPWVGEFWDMFYAGHTVEMQNLKKILEYRHQNGLPMGPHRGVL
ncbi:SRPBCC family protein [Bdellovibrionota bacterium FG-1]